MSNHLKNSFAMNGINACIEKKQNNAITISVIVPVYNVEDYICRFINALREEKQEGMEFIFVDDASTDCSSLFLNEYAKNDSRIQIIRNPVNIGQGASRNKGIREARGEYLSFMDPDDWSGPGFFTILYRRAKENDLDIVKGRSQYDRSDGSMAVHYELNDYIRDNIGTKPLYLLFPYQIHSALFRREMILSNNVEFGLARRDQDTTFLLRACCCASSFDITDEAIYHRCERKGSVLHNIDEFMLREQFVSLKEQLDYLSGRDFEDNNATRYALIKIMQFLSFQEQVAFSSGDGSVSLDILKEARAYIMTLPFRDDLISSNASVLALVTTGKNIPEKPYHLPWHEATPEQWMRIAFLWTDFAIHHPAYSVTHCDAIKQVYTNAKKAGCDVAILDTLWESMSAQWKR